MMRPRAPGANPNMRFTNWNYGTTIQQGRGGGYTEHRAQGQYNQTQGFGFSGPRHQGFNNRGGPGGPPGGNFRGRGGPPGGFRGRGGPPGRGGPGYSGGPPGRGGYNQGPQGGYQDGIRGAPLPDQNEVMPDEVKASVEKDKWKLDKTPGVIVKGEDGSYIKIAADNHDDDVDLDAAPEPTRFDKSVQSILNGRNAAMYVAIECKKRQWELEFECLEADGPVHNRVYSYSLTVGPPGSDDVIVAAGIAKGKREAKRRCCDAMVLKMDDLPPAPPLVVQMQMRGMRVQPGFRPRLPPPESEDTVFKKYDKTAYGDDHPNKNHPVFQLCSKAKRLHWPPPQFELVTEKIVDTIRNKHGKSNTMLYTYKVTVWPGVGQVEPKVFFGSGPTKKDAKFACGTIAWAAIQNPSAVKSQLGADGSLPTADPSQPGVSGADAAQLAVKMAAEVTGPKLKSAQHVTENKWLEQVARAAERSVDLKAEVEQLKAEKQKKKEEEEAQREADREKRRKEREERRARSRSRSKKRKSERYSRDRSRDRSVKRERSSYERSHKRDRRSRSRSVKKERRSRSRTEKKDRRSRSRSVKKEKRSRSRERRRSRS